MNSTKEVYNPVDLEINSTEVFILLIMLGWIPRKGNSMQI
jgi:hypothetical protein